MPIFDDTLAAQYIRAIENPDSIGYRNGRWYQSDIEGHDTNNRGFGVDVQYNKDASALAGKRPGKWLTEDEERELRLSHLNYNQEVLDKYIPPKYLLDQPISEEKKAMALGMLYRGDGIKSIIKNPTISEAFFHGTNEDMQKAVSDYYTNEKPHKERVVSHNRFFSSKRKTETTTDPYKYIRKPEPWKAKSFADYQYKPNTKFSEGGSLNDYWNNLPMKEKAEMMRVAISNGITTLPEIKEAYNKFAEGGAKDKWTMEDEAGYRHFPKNLRDTNDRDYDMRAAYKAGMQPEWNDEDKSYHLATRDPKTGRILKSPLHPTFLKGLLTDASLGYYPTMDSRGNIYTKTWPGNMYAQGGKKGSNSEDNVQRAMGYLMSRGMSRTGAAAIVGTLQAESSLDPTIHAKMKGDTGEGLAQWTGSRKKNFWKTLESIEPGAQKKYGSIDRVPMERQLDVVLAERPDVTNAIHNAKDVNTATDIMLRGYENGGGAVGSMASREQMDKIYGKWNNGYNNQMKKRLGYASSILGLNVSPLDYEISQDYFNNMSKQIDDIALSQMSQLSSQQDIDPEFRYKPPVIDWASMKEEKQTQQKLEIPDDGKDNLNRLMGVLGAIGYNDPLLNNIKTIQDNPLMAVANMYS